MKHTVTHDVREPRTITMSEMTRGQIGVVVSEFYRGRVVLCAYGGVVVDLSDGDTWDASPLNMHEVRLFPEGAAVTIKVGA